MPTAVIVLLGGWGRRFGGPLPKQLIAFDDKSVVFEQSASRLTKALNPEYVCLVVNADLREHTEFTRALGRLQRSFADTEIIITAGGKTRHQSFVSGARALPNLELNLVIHDANRPYLSDDLLARLGASLNELSPNRLMAWALLHQFGSLKRAVSASGEPVPDTLEELGSRLYS